MPRRSPFVIELTNEERVELGARVKKYTSPYRDVMRAKIVLLASEGLGNDRIAARLSMPRQIVSKWRQRYYTQRLTWGISVNGLLLHGGIDSFSGCRFRSEV